LATRQREKYIECEGVIHEEVKTYFG